MAPIARSPQRPAEPPAPRITLRLESQEQGLKAAVILPAASTEKIQFQKLLSVLASAGFLGAGYDLSQEHELARFDAVAQKQEMLLREQQEFYTQVEAHFSEMAQTIQKMKRDYYREIDHLREQLSRSARDPRFKADNVMFFDPESFRLPPWEDIVELLDGMRMKRELLKDELGGDRVRMVPVSMLCQKCRRKFQSPEEAAKAYREEHRDQSVQVCLKELLASDAEVQTAEKPMVPADEVAPAALTSSASTQTEAQMERHGEGVHGSTNSSRKSESEINSQLLTVPRGAATASKAQSRSGSAASSRRKIDLDSGAHLIPAPGVSGQLPRRHDSDSASSDRRRAGDAKAAEATPRPASAGTSAGGSVSARSLASTSEEEASEAVGADAAGVTGQESSYLRARGEKPRQIQRPGVDDELGGGRAGEASSRSGHSPTREQKLGAQRIADSLEKIFSRGPQAKERRAMSFLQRRERTRKERAAGLLARQLEALRKHQERFAFSRLKLLVQPKNFNPEFSNSDSSRVAPVNRPLRERPHARKPPPTGTASERSRSLGRAEAELLVTSEGGRSSLPALTNSFSAAMRQRKPSPAPQLEAASGLQTLPQVLGDANRVKGRGQAMGSHRPMASSSSAGVLLNQVDVTKHASLGLSGSTRWG